MAAEKILIVEDERILAEDLKEMLLDMGYQVCGISSSGKDAIDQVSKENVEMVLMDIKLEGEMDGIKAAEIIKHRYDTPVIYLTALSDDTVLAQAKATEPFGYIVKPYRASEIRPAVEIAFFKIKVQRELKEAYRQLEQEVKSRTLQLEEMNTALKVLLEYRESEKVEILRTLSESLKTLIIPHLDTIEMKCSAKDIKDILSVVKRNLEKMTHPLAKPFSDQLGLTSMELRVVDLIRHGRSTKEIAQLLGITARGVTFHRDNIRKKMGIHNRRTRLKSALNEGEA
jgi:DNA-binding NarL/FixJ family response regulator